MQKPAPDHRFGLTADEPQRHAARQQIDVLVCVLLLCAGCLAAGGAFPRRIGWPLPAGIGDVHRVRTGIDPDEARWFELAHLPGIGRSLARRIVATREELRAAAGRGRRVFHGPNDLTLVKGIGEKKVLRMGRLLRFADADRQR